MNPKVEFKVGSLKDNIYIIKNFYDELEDKIKMLYPDIDKNNIDEIVTKIYNQNKDEYIKSASDYSKLWSKYSSEYFNFIKNYLKVDVIKDITAYIILLPIFPRNLDNNSFYMSPNMYEKTIIEVIKHEITHFYWFKKFHEVYPSIDKKEYNSPYKPWIYSEMVIDPILGQRAYDEYYDLKYNNKYVMDELRKIYEESTSIDEKIKRGYEYINKVF